MSSYTYMYRINKQKENKVAVLAKFGESIFHADDLANLWQIENKHILYITLSRYTKKEILFRIYKGFYSLKPLNEIDPFILGSKAIHSYCYLSTEAILSEAGIIQQKVDKITFIGDKSKNFKIGKYFYSERRLKDEFLYNPAGIIDDNGVKKATTARAIADLLYFNPHYFFDAKDLINWKEVSGMQKKVGYPLT
ncbi:MAG: hypothetical protein V1860_04250 [bacterium]